MPSLIKINKVKLSIGNHDIIIIGEGEGNAGMPIVTKLASEITATLDPDKCYIWQGNPASLAITLGTPTDNTVVHEYMFIFESGSTPTVFSLTGSNLKWDENIDISTWTTEANTTYEFHIANNIVRVGGAK